MSSLARTLFVLSLTSALAGCDRSSEFEDCVFVADPEASSASRGDRCPPSTFKAEDKRGREVAGIVRRGEDVVPNAFVRVDPSADLRSGLASSGDSTITDAVGFFGGLRLATLRYDLSVRFDQEVLVYRAVASRYFDPSIEAPSRLSRRAWTGRVDVSFDRPVPAGHTVAFFASGDGVFGVTGDSNVGLGVLVREYTFPATLHAVEYEIAGGLETASAYGKVDVTVDAGAVRLATIPLAPITGFAEPKFAVTAPSGFAPTAVDVIIGFTRTSDARLSTLEIGKAKRLPILPNAGYTYRLRATSSDGAVSDSGETGFDVYRPETTIALVEPPLAVSPLEGETRGPSETLQVSGAGVFEHVLVPQAGGPALRIIAKETEVALPDVRALGAAAAVGPYTWTVRSFPTGRFVEELAGVDSRRYRAVGISAPRSIVLR